MAVPVAVYGHRKELPVYFTGTMFRLILVTALLLQNLGCLTAQKHDNVWVFGYRFTDSLLSNGIFFHFNDSLEITYKQKPMDFALSSACISDSAGSLQMYSNGCYVENNNGTEIPGSSGLNPGITYDIFCDDDVGYNMPQNMIIVHQPNNQKQLYLFHLPADYFIKNLVYTIIDLNLNNGQGGTVVKNKPVFVDSMSADGVHAVRHANGRDWWIITAKYKSNKYYTLLLTPEGLFPQPAQIIGVPTSSGAGGQIVFSPDGSKLARFNTRDDLRIFDFDRCNGLLSNPVFIPIQDNADNELFAGLAWSADGRFLYAAEIKRVLQFDATAVDIAASKSIVAEREPEFYCPFLVNLAYLELGPDGYIYANSLGGQRCMHRIKYPERAGEACMVQQHYYTFEFPYANLPHFPNFRLGPLDGSSCDTLGLNNNPLSGWRYDRAGGLDVDFTSVSWYEPQEWLWDFGDGNQSTQRNPAHTFPAPGAYDVCLTVSNQYGSNTKCKTVWLTTVSNGWEPQSKNRVIISPNPTTGVIHWMGEIDENSTIRLFNHLGTKVLEQQPTVPQIDLSTLANGLYLLEITDSSGVKYGTQKIVLVK